MIPPQHPDNRQPDAPHKGNGRQGESDALLRTAAGGSAVATVGSVVGRFLGFALQVIICRAFAPSDYGHFLTGMIILQMLRHPFSLGLQKGAMRFFSMAHARQEFSKMPAIFGVAILVPFALGLVGSVALYLLSDWISLTCFKDPAMAPILRAFSGALPFFSLMMIGSELTRAFKSTKWSVLIEEVIFPTVQITLLMILYLMGLAFEAVIYSCLVASVVAGTFAVLIVAKLMRRVMGRHCSLAFIFKNSVNLPFWREIIVFSLPLMPIGMSLVGFHFSDILIMNYFMDHENVGRYAAAAKIAMLFAGLIRTTNLVFSPLIAMQYGVEDIRHIEMLYKSLTRWMFYVSFPVLVFVIITREPIMQLMGDGFLDQAPMTLAILAVGHVFIVSTGGAGLILTMTAHPYKELWTIVAGLIMNIGLNVLLIPRYGLIGAATAATASRILINMVRIFIVYRIFRIQPWSSKFLLPLGIGVAGLVLHYALASTMHIGHVADIAIATVATLAVLASILMTGMENDDRTLMTQVWRKIIRKPPLGPPPPGMKRRPPPNLEETLEPLE